MKMAQESVLFATHRHNRSKQKFDFARQIRVSTNLNRTGLKDCIDLATLNQKLKHWTPSMESNFMARTPILTPPLKKSTHFVLIVIMDGGELKSTTKVSPHNWC